jgi:hypothetical protein
VHPQPLLRRPLLMMMMTMHMRMLLLLLAPRLHEM